MGIEPVVPTHLSLTVVWRAGRKLVLTSAQVGRVHALHAINEFPVGRMRRHEASFSKVEAKFDSS